MATTGNVHEHMARLRLKMMQQRLQKERERPDSGDDKTHEQYGHIKLQQAMLKRQELLEKMKQEQLWNNGRPRSHREMRSPVSPPPSRRSLPDRSRKYYRSHALEPLPNPPQPPVNIVMHNPPNNQSVKIDPPPVPQPTQPYYVQQPNPIIHTVPPEPSRKGDYMEMMMMQNAQMHQYVMQQMMLSSMPNNRGPNFTIPLGMAHEPPPRVISFPENRPESVHHHHYSLPQAHVDTRPIVNHVTQLPPLHLRREPPPPSPSPTVRMYPAEVEPLRQPRVRIKPAEKTHLPTPKPIRKHPFPGSRALRKLRHIFYAAWFIAFLKSEVKKNKHKKPSDKFLFGILLKEAVAALHRIYLNPDGQIFPILRDAVGEGAIDLSVTDNPRPNTDDKQALQELVYNVENLVYHITEIMPAAGVLGTHKKASVFEMLKNGKEYPRGYFWQIERDQLQFDANDAIRNVGDKEAIVLLLGIFISRSLVTTLMMKPLDYGLSTMVLGEVAENNLRLLATIIIYLVRKASVPTKQTILTLPHEISKYLYADSEMQTTFSKIKKSLDYAEGLLRDWSEEYVNRLRAAAPK